MAFRKPFTERFWLPHDARLQDFKSSLGFQSDIVLYFTNSANGTGEEGTDAWEILEVLTAYVVQILRIFTTRLGNR